jgi:aldehyde:ferredoxin oxidoreductase
LKSGPYKGEVLDREKFEEMKDEYYQIRGWNKETGVPTREKLVELNLAAVADEVLGKA